MHTLNDSPSSSINKPQVRKEKKRIVPRGQHKRILNDLHNLTSIKPHREISDPLKQSGDYFRGLAMWKVKQTKHTYFEGYDSSSTH